MKSLVKINSMAANDPAFLVSKAEERYSDRLDEIAERIFSDREKRIVMLAGPSASGKTTTAGLIASRLESRGAKAFTVSLDDFIMISAMPFSMKTASPTMRLSTPSILRSLTRALRISSKRHNETAAFRFCQRQAQRLLRPYNARQGRCADSRGYPRPEPGYNRLSAE